jgi:hypothetical protein
VWENIIVSFDVVYLRAPIISCTAALLHYSMRSTAAFLFWIAWAFYSLVVDAEVNLVRNGDFSTAAAEKLGSSTWVYDTPEAWTATGASVIIHKDDAAWGGIQPASGNYLQGIQGVGSYISQIISFPSAGNYELSLSACSRPGYGRAGLDVAITMRNDGGNSSVTMVETKHRFVEYDIGYAFTRYSIALGIKAANATMEIRNVGGEGGDRTLLVDAIRISTLANLVANGDFSTAACMTCDRPDGFGAQYQCKMAALAVARSLGRPYYHIPLNRSVGRMKFMSDDGAAALEDAMGFARRQLERPLGLACYNSVHDLETSRIPDRDPSFYCKVMPIPNP